MLVQDACYITAREDLDQQLTRLLNCDLSGSADPIHYDIPEKPVLYELPKGSPVNAPIDATAIVPGASVTLDPSPSVSLNSETVLPGSEVEKNGIGEWIKNNPLLVAGIGIGILVLITGKKNRK